MNEEAFADGRRRGREEFADMRRSRDLGLTAYRLPLIRHSTCACGAQATCLQGSVYRCRLCAAWATTKRRARAMGALR
jgi:hypothetical protein